MRKVLGAEVWHRSGYLRGRGSTRSLGNTKIEMEENAAHQPSFVFEINILAQNLGVAHFSVNY